MRVRQPRWLIVILAAGRSRRFAASVPESATEPKLTDKLALPLADGQSVLVHTLRCMRSLTDRAQLAVLTRTECHSSYSRWAVEAGIDHGIEWLIHPEAEAGIGRSIAAAASWALSTSREARYLVLALGDMPWLRPATLERLLVLMESAAPAPLAGRPIHAGQPGHPVIFARSLWPALTQLRGDLGAKDLLNRLSRDQKLEFETDDPGVLADIDTYADWLLSGSFALRRSP